MGTTTIELVETGDKRAGNGRRVTSAERRSELVAAYRQSGLTMAAFARREGMRYSTFAGWVLKSGRRRAPAVRFAQVQLPPMAPAGLEVRLPDGTVLRGGSAEELAALVRALGR
jgi:transposase-like protein